MGARWLGPLGVLVDGQLPIGEVEASQVVRGRLHQGQLLLHIGTLVQRIGLRVNDSFVEAVDHIIRVEAPAAFHSLRGLKEVGGVGSDP